MKRRGRRRGRRRRRRGGRGVKERRAAALLQGVAAEAWGQMLLFGSERIGRARRSSARLSFRKIKRTEKEFS